MFLVCLYLAFIVEILFKFIAVKYHKLSSSGVSLSAIIMRPMNTCKKYIMLRGKAKTQKSFFSLYLNLCVPIGVILKVLIKIFRPLYHQPYEYKKK